MAKPGPGGPVANGLPPSKTPGHTPFSNTHGLSGRKRRGFRPPLGVFGLGVWLLDRLESPAAGASRSRGRQPVPSIPRGAGGRGLRPLTEAHSGLVTGSSGWPRSHPPGGRSAASAVEPPLSAFCECGTGYHGFGRRLPRFVLATVVLATTVQGINHLADSACCRGPTRHHAGVGLEVATEGSVPTVQRGLRVWVVSRCCLESRGPFAVSQSWTNCPGRGCTP